MSNIESPELEDQPIDANRTTSSPNGEERANSSSRMVRHARARPWHRSRTRSILIVLWTIFTVFLAIMIIVILVQPQWLGGVPNKDGQIVNFGLYRSCPESWEMCSAAMADFSKIPSNAWKVSTLLVIFSIFSTFISIIIMAVYWLKCRETAGFGFRYATGFQVFTGCCLLLTCFIYPGGWDVPEVREICGQNADSYKTGNCEVRWAFGIAIIAMFDAFILALLSYFFIEQRVVSRPLEAVGGQSRQMNGSATSLRQSRHREEEENTQL
ncbi:LHFPL tetraspan subfamily member 3 protein-like [Actinia tenebrosa]|uniref:LHFPL tetraspan subfamily member 3 protein-like n=1 Tax=Actinia tenebrosa TaxID=6105 RepID=A0A6P8HSG1_ACTTE|nr:LHFPL tetraspan subfamily member 3 protein-like [Actinia tenebrosa]